MKILDPLMDLTGLYLTQPFAASGDRVSSNSTQRVVKVEGKRHSLINFQTNFLTSNHLYR